LLCGYGCAINLKANRICLKDGTNPFTGKQQVEEWFVTQIPYQKIEIAGKDYITTDAIYLLTEHNTNVILLDSFGNVIANMNNVMSSPTGTNYRIGQYDTFRDSKKLLYLQKMLVAFKLQSQINFLKSLDRPEYSEAITGLTVYLAKINSPIANEKCDDFLTIEERSGHLYFSNYVKLFPPNYWFE
jgi:CRISPR-associated protein Cas1